MQNIIWKKPDGSIAVTHLIEATCPEAEAKRLIKRALEGWAAAGNDPAMRPEILDCEHVCSNAEMPPDKTWRAAWAWITDDPVVDICPVRAVEITKSRLRLERAPLLAELDLAFQRAHEIGDTKAMTKIAAEKQRLRDLPSMVHQVASGDLQTLAALKASA